MDLFRAIIFRRLMKAYFPEFSLHREISGAEVIERLSAMLDSANETIKEDLCDRSDYRDAIDMAEQAEDLFYSSRG